ncbi:MAG: glycerol-3-phosphate cytidylyltransferase [Proteobacteria bacterium]|nr:glycerol-3-phosphate cytidylyltransferase [Pseudomonadota bacterium]
MGNKKSQRVITFGSYDLFHVGHFNILRRAAELGDTLIVGISSDALHKKKKGDKPHYPFKLRAEIVSSLRFVDQIFLEASLDKKVDYIRRYKADILVMGSDWKGTFDSLSSLCKVVYLPRTEGISSTLIRSILHGEK